MQKNKDSMDIRDKIQKVLIEFSEGEVYINKATDDILALFNVVGQSEQLPPRCVMDMPASKYCNCSNECKWCENIKR